MKTIQRKYREERLEGVGVCQGVAIGRAFLVDDPRGRIVRDILHVEGFARGEYQIQSCREEEQRVA